MQQEHSKQFNALPKIKLKSKGADNLQLGTSVLTYDDARAYKDDDLSEIFESSTPYQKFIITLSQVASLSTQLDPKRTFSFSIDLESSNLLYLLDPNTSQDDSKFNYLKSMEKSFPHITLQYLLIEEDNNSEYSTATILTLNNLMKKRAKDHAKELKDSETSSLFDQNIRIEQKTKKRNFGSKNKEQNEGNLVKTLDLSGYSADTLSFEAKMTHEDDPHEQKSEEHDSIAKQIALCLDKNLDIKQIILPKGADILQFKQVIPTYRFDQNHITCHVVHDQLKSPSRSIVKRQPSREIRSDNRKNYTQKGQGLHKLTEIKQHFYPPIKFEINVASYWHAHPNSESIREQKTFIQIPELLSHINLQSIPKDITNILITEDQLIHNDQLLKPLIDQGYQIFIDNRNEKGWINSISEEPDYWSNSSIRSLPLTSEYQKKIIFLFPQNDLDPPRSISLNSLQLQLKRKRRNSVSGINQVTPIKRRPSSHTKSLSATTTNSTLNLPASRRGSIPLSDEQHKKPQSESGSESNPKTSHQAKESEVELQLVSQDNYSISDEARNDFQDDIVNIKKSNKNQINEDGIQYGTSTSNDTENSNTLLTFERSESEKVNGNQVNNKPNLQISTQDNNETSNQANNDSQDDIDNIVNIEKSNKNQTNENQSNNKLNSEIFTDDISEENGKKLLLNGLNQTHSIDKPIKLYDNYAVNLLVMLFASSLLVLSMACLLFSAETVASSVLPFYYYVIMSLGGYTIPVAAVITILSLIAYITKTTQCEKTGRFASPLAIICGIFTCVPSLLLFGIPLLVSSPLLPLIAIILGSCLQWLTVFMRALNRQHEQLPSKLEISMYIITPLLLLMTLIAVVWITQPVLLIQAFIQLNNPFAWSIALTICLFAVSVCVSIFYLVKTKKSKDPTSSSLSISISAGTLPRPSYSNKTSLCCLPFYHKKPGLAKGVKLTNDIDNDDSLSGSSTPK